MELTLVSLRHASPVLLKAWTDLFLPCPSCLHLTTCAALSNIFCDFFVLLPLIHLNSA